MTHKVFVYGTLKRGFRNHRLLDVPGAAFLSEGRTVEAHPLFADGLPFVIKRPGTGGRVRGELFEVDDETLADLDRLEGHPRYYRREEVLIQPATGEAVKAWLYFYQGDAPAGATWLREFARDGRHVAA